jgi:hypothetical protein
MSDKMSSNVDLRESIEGSNRRWIGGDGLVSMKISPVME